MRIQDTIEGFLLDRRPRCSDDAMRWRRYLNERDVFDIEQLTVGHLRAYIVGMQNTVANAEHS
jgi:hypothetical protein